MRYAQIKNNLIVNVIVLNNANLVSLFTQGFDYCIRVDELDPEPCIGWSFDPFSGNFSIPEVEL